MKYLLRLLIISALIAGNAHAAGRINTLISGGFLLDGLSTLDFTGNAQTPDSESGYGVVFDYIWNGHALGIDYYSFSEDYDNLGSNGEVDLTYEATALFMGYRYHFSSGFYLGGGISQVDFSDAVSGAPQDGTGVFRTEDPNYDTVTSPTFTLGYQKRFNSGLSLGTHLLYTLGEDIEHDAGVIEDFSIQNIGFLIGYAWE